MAKGGAIGRLGKLKCMIKRWQQTKAQLPHQHLLHDDTDSNVIEAPSVDRVEKVPEGMHTVFVGKTRRKYTITSHVVRHPLFRVLVQRSGALMGRVGEGGGNSDDADMVVCCEVVLFEHLLWMLDNADPQPESLDELVEFYAC